jgi:hypothetical protein
LIDQAKTQIGALARPGRRRIHLPTFGEHFLNRRVRRLEAQDRADVDIAAGVFFVALGEYRLRQEHCTHNEQCAHHLLPV